MNKYVNEFIGTFFLMFTVVCAVNAFAPLAPVAIGAALMVMIYAGGHISGAHYNPAVSIAAFVRGRLHAADLGPYIGAQVLGSIVAALLGGWLFDAEAPKAWSGEMIAQAGVVELLFTFALCWVVLNVATSKDHPDNSFYGLAIGFTVAAGAVAVGPISGAAFNPAVAIGASLAHLTAWGNIWVFLLAQVIAGVAAGYAFKALNPDDTAPLPAS